MKRDMIAIKHEIDSVQLVKDEIDDIRESLDRLEAESQRRKNKLLEQVRIDSHMGVKYVNENTYRCRLTETLAKSRLVSVLYTTVQ